MSPVKRQAKTIMGGGILENCKTKKAIIQNGIAQSQPTKIVAPSAAANAMTI